MRSDDRAGRRSEATAARVPEPRRARDPLARELPAVASLACLGATAATLLFLELRRPLRVRREAKLPHDLRNLGMAALSAATIRLLERPLVAPLAARVHARRLGLLKRLRLPAWLELLAGVVLLDYTLYVWHVLTHRVPFLWRFHRVHHADLDLEASTAVRFHCIEMALSVPWRAAQVRVLGAAPRVLSAWQTATLAAILFHHANVRLPLRVERVLCRWLMTPRLHGIHHSVERSETDSNWATILAWPDRLHGTQRLDVPQGTLDIGIPAPHALAELGLGALVALPFRRGPGGTRADARPGRTPDAYRV